MSQLTTQQNKSLEKALWDLVKIKNENIFDFITRSIAYYLGADFAFISILPELENEQVKTISFFADGCISTPYHYDLKGTPCALVIQHSDIISYEQNIQHEFLDDQDLIDMDIQSYVGVSLTDANNNVIGLMSIMSHKPFIKTLFVEKIFEVYRSRASIELARLINKNKAQKSEQNLLNMIDKDSLTQLPNHSSLMNKISRLITKEQLLHARASVLYIDIDDFKKTNEIFGHVIGDQILIEISKRLSALCRKKDFIARVGGDEFILLAEDLDNEQHAGQIAERIISELSCPMFIHQENININVSIGIAAIRPEPNISTSALIEYAGVAMYEAKKTGKNNFCYFTKTLESQYKRKKNIANRLSSALKNNEFSLVYQPIIDITNNTLFGVEALLRWNCRELGYVEPEEFIPISEEKNLIQPIGDFVLRSACQQLTQWNKQVKHHALKLNINISPLQLAYQQSDKHILSILNKHKSLKKQLVLEITESILIDNTNLALDTLNTLFKQGICFALDDFGTGYSSLTYLMKMPVNYLKIDQSFIQKTTTLAEARAIVQSTIKLAEVLNIDIIAEGVKTEAQLNFLKQHGCKLVQGYYFHKPMPAEDISKLISAPPSK
ncbi:MAG: sensor domain-containing phosphodiesterase [Legionellaceae bacterium]|nr:sensor domain-containing phosphodiesterase [Legionellaceae bacterium]